MGAIHHNTNSMRSAGGAFWQLAGGASEQLVVGTADATLRQATGIDFAKTRIVPPAAETRAP